MMMLRSYCVSLFLLLLLVVLLPLYATEASAMKNCIDTKSMCNKNDTCKKKFKEMNKKCRFSDHICFNDDNSVRCKELMYDITYILGADAFCNCLPYKNVRELIKCNDIYNRIHANPCTFVPPTTHERSSTHDITTQPEVMTSPITTTTTTQEVTSLRDDIMTTPITEIQNIISTQAPTNSAAENIESIHVEAARQVDQVLQLLNKTDDIRQFVEVYKTHVRPRLERHTRAWSPHLRNSTDRAEYIQEMLTEMAFERAGRGNTTSYRARLDRLELATLKQRSLMFEMSYLYKIINSQSTAEFDRYFVFLPANGDLKWRKFRPTNGNHSRQIRTKDDLEVEWRDYLTWVAALWNSLPETVRTSVSAREFRRRVRQLDLSALQ